jgi:hypothetical protein
MEIYILIVIVTAVTTGIVVYALTRSLDAEWNRKWTLSIVRDGQIGWMPILERHLNDKSWEYIYIIEDNLALITHIANMGIPSSPLIDSDERVYKMIQDMIKRGHGHIDPRRLHQ